MLNALYLGRTAGSHPGPERAPGMSLGPAKRKWGVGEQKKEGVTSSPGTERRRGLQMALTGPPLFPTSPACISFTPSPVCLPLHLSHHPPLPSPSQQGAAESSRQRRQATNPICEPSPHPDSRAPCSFQPRPNPVGSLTPSSSTQCLSTPSAPQRSLPSRRTAHCTALYYTPLCLDYDRI